MKPECAATIQAAAGDRKLSDKELRGIEERLLQSAKTLRRRDPAAWATMSPAERYTAAAKAARASQVEQMAQAHAAALDRIAKKTTNDALVYALKPGDQLKGLFTRLFMDHSNAGGTSLESHVRAESTRLATQFDEKTEGALNDPAMTLAIARELTGKDSGNAEAKDVAKKVADALERSRQRMVRAGIAVNRLENYNMPQPWDWTRFAASDREEWVKKHLARLDLSEFIRPDGSQMSADEIRHTLEESWLTLHTNGANKRAAGTARGNGGRTGSKYNAPRQLHFKDAESWLASMREYGVSDNLGTILREHFQRRGRDIAVAEHEGNMADRDVRERADKALANDLAAANTAKEKHAITAMHKKTLSMWNVLAHGHSMGSATWAARMGAIRAVMSASRLGTLVTQQPSDALMALNYLKTLGFDKPATVDAASKSLFSRNRKAFLRAAGIWSDNLHDTTSRFGDTEIYNNVSRFLNGTVYKISGMRAADRATTGVIADSVLGSFGRRSHETANVDALPKKMAALVKRFGITQEHWDVLRMAELDRGDSGDRTAVTPDAIYAIPPERLEAIAGARLAARGAAATDAAVADEVARLKDETVSKLLAVFQDTFHAAGRGFAGSSLTEQQRLGLLTHEAGTPLGEAIRALWMIRQVPMGLMYTHLWQVPRGLEGFSAKAGYVARYAFGQMLATGIAIQLKHLINGEDPEDMETKGFLAKMAAGGVVGPLLASLVFGSAGEHAAAGIPLGPFGDAIQQAMQLEARGVDEIEGKEPGKRDRFSAEKYASQWLAFVRSNAVPFANIWYVKSLFNHLIYQQAQEAVSPGYSERVRERMQHEQRGTWWEPGDTAPQRAPDYGAAVGQPTQP
jgi:hypothetical protein